MTTQYLYVFVEGAIDELFIEKLFIKELKLSKDNYTIIKYASQEKKKIVNYIKSIKSIPIYDYVFIADQDGQLNKKEQKLKELPCLDEEKLFISIYEIESWIIAGISKNLIKKYKIKPIELDTSYITKEIFNSITPRRVNKIEFISSILSDFDLKNAVKLNESLNIFINYLLKKAS